MSGLRQLLRLTAIYRVIVRYRLHEIGLSARMLGPARYLFGLFRLSPSTWRRRPAGTPGERLRLSLQDLGPIFVKFGQALSTRPDLLPGDVARELALLQDRVPPFPGSIARQQLETIYGRPVSEVFASFEEEPLASASIAQVHNARLREGPEVVVKVLRPGVEQTIQRDIEVLRSLAALAHRYLEESRRLRPIEIVAEYEKTIFDELDLLREAGNAAQLKRNFPEGRPLYVPEVYFDYCRPGVMVLERIHGIPVSDIPRLRALGVDMERLAELGVEIFFTQVFRHNFFHADMHPGNIFVEASEPADPRYIAVDFGIVGTLTPEDRRYLAGNLLAFFERDYRRVAELHVESRWVPEGTRVDELESAIRTVCEPIFNRPLKEISFGHFLVRLFRIARRFNMEVQPQLVLLQKTLLNIEGLGRQLYPELDLWRTAKPFLEEWTAEQVSGRELFKRLRDHLPQVSESLQLAPQMAFGVLKDLSEGNLRVTLHEDSLRALERSAGLRRRSRYAAWSGASLLIAGALLLSFAVDPVWAGWLTGAGGLALLYMGRPRV